MRAEEVLALRRSFVAKWGEAFATLPSLALDGTWPSIGVLDLIALPLRNKEQLNSEELGTVRGIAAYLALLCAECWESIGATVQVTRGPQGVMVSTSAGPGIGEGESVIHYIERDLLNFLKRVPESHEVLPGHTRIISNEEQLLPQFTLGRCLGLSPYGTGPWRRMPLESWGDQLSAIVKHLAMQCATWYERVHPDEQIGQIAELYIYGLIFPPPFLFHSWPTLEGVQGVAAFCERYKLTLPQLAQTAYNLAFSPLETISDVGFVLFAALDVKVDDRMRMLVQSKGSRTAMLRQALLEARKWAGGEGEWLDETEKLSASAQQVVQRELDLGFLPWVTLEHERLISHPDQPLLRDFIRATTVFNLKRAQRIVAELVTESPDDLSLRVQQSYLYVVACDGAGAVQGVRSALSTPKADECSSLLVLHGVLQLGAGDYQAARNDFERAVTLCEVGSWQWADALNNLGWACVLAGAFADADRSFTSALQAQPGFLVAALNQIGVLYRLERSSEADELRAWLTAQLPSDRRVFVGRFIELLVPIAGEAEVAKAA